MRLPEWLGLSEKRWKKTPDEEIRPAKTAWDWLQLLVVPVVLAVLAIALNSWQSDREAKREEARVAREAVREDQRRRQEQALAREARLDDTLRTYFTQM